MLIQDKNGKFCQQFVFENLPVVCYQCERIGDVDEGCRFTEGDPSLGNNDGQISPNNLVVMGGELGSDGPPFAGGRE